MGSRKEKKDRRRKLGIGMTPSQKFKKRMRKEAKEFEEKKLSDTS